ncbi:MULTISPECIES: LysR substrate-binding domain-containing protein [Modicisalibacter]|uniref:LysR substrate-binding domain-containing protein n=1 Tax=Modicisalibacter TaxID=574347 RepID=UPI00100B4611|nr:MULTISPECIES: LysR substrate-binding domain-containing protein [Halomonadaceae]MBZ9559210.1 LysR family transcriptional regulator [Modicisalibacter sp. R2A 31.J]MBZ9576625.1 LysR family transcriptional regulator [Modicisalibacter sp. MOD 31.J]
MSSHDALPPLACLRAFEVAGRHLSFTQAGAELNLTQSAVSRQIKRLEADLGRPLFERGHDGLRLTPAGEQYYRVVRQLLRDLGDVSARLRRRGGERQLTLAASPTIASLWLARRLPDFQRAYPDIALRILTVEDPHRLDLAEFDLGLYYHVPGEVEPDGLTAEPIFVDEDVIAVCSPLYRQHHGEVRDAEDLLDRHTLLVVEDHYHDWLTWEAWFAGVGLSWRRPERTLRANSYQLLMNATLAGQGVTLGWSRLLERDLAGGELIRALPQALPSRGRLALLSPQHRHRTEAMQTFRRWLLG